MSWKELQTLEKNDRSFYDLQSSSFRNSVYALNISLETKFNSLLLKGETNRIIYCLNNFAFRKRSQNQTNNNLNFPFINYKAKAIKIGGDRKWFNPHAYREGVYVEVLNRKLKMNPITIAYESTLFLQRDDELQYCYQILSNESAVETKVDYEHHGYSLTILGQDVEMLGILKYKLDFEPTYSDTTWLTQNKIHSISMDFEVQTTFVTDNIDISVPRKLIFNFETQNSEELIENITTEEAIINHYSEENTII
jgi:hypothetical protein